MERVSRGQRKERGESNGGGNEGEEGVREGRRAEVREKRSRGDGKKGERVKYDEAPDRMKEGTQNFCRIVCSNQDVRALVGNDTAGRSTHVAGSNTAHLLHGHLSRAQSTSSRAALYTPTAGANRTFTMCLKSTHACIDLVRVWERGLIRAHLRTSQTDSCSFCYAHGILSVYKTQPMPFYPFM